MKKLAFKWLEESADEVHLICLGQRATEVGRVVSSSDGIWQCYTITWLTVSTPMPSKDAAKRQFIGVMNFFLAMVDVEAEVFEQ